MRELAQRAPEPSLLHGIIRSKPGEAYRQKREAFEALLHDHGEDLDGFANRIFGDAVFKGTEVRKADLVLELLRDELSTKSWRFVRDRLRVQPFLTDRRHTEEYAFDIALGWLEEELVIRELEKLLPRPTLLERIGIDHEREFLELNIKAVADLAIRTPTGELLVDLFVDHKGTWRANGGMDLKRGKLGHLRNGRLHFVVGLDLQARNYRLVAPADIEGIETFANASMGGTETARIPIADALTLSQVATRLASVVGTIVAGTAR